MAKNPPSTALSLYAYPGCVFGASGLGGVAGGLGGTGTGRLPPRSRTEVWTGGRAVTRGGGASAGMSAKEAGLFLRREESKERRKAEASGKGDCGDVVDQWRRGYV